MKYCYCYESIIGNLFIAETQARISAVSKVFDLSGFEYAETDLIRSAYKQLNEYFDGKRTIFDLPLYIEGTNFQKQVWQALQEIPYGQTRTYKDIAQDINHPLAYRAVGGACNKNPLLILVPCHRVIGVNNSLTGFAIGVDIKQKLLNLEAELCMKN